MGRRAFDEETARTLEVRYPNVRFDWDALRSTPPPAPVEPWRERRRAERAARMLREPDQEAAAVAPELVSLEPSPPARSEEFFEREAGPPPPGNSLAGSSETPGPNHAAVPGGPPRRRRRRGRRSQAQDSRPVEAPAGTASRSSTDKEPVRDDGVS